MYMEWILSAKIFANDASFSSINERFQTIRRQLLASETDSSNKHFNSLKVCFNYFSIIAKAILEF